MKSSLFNTFLKVTNDSTIIYNAFEDKTIVCKGDLNAINILSQHTSLLEKLKKEGFIVPEIKDEYSCYVDEARKAEDDGKTFHLLINPTLNCNFSCWYCYESHFPSQMSEQIILRIIRLIDNIFSEGRSLTISFFGGEPLLYYQQVMTPILKYAHLRAQEHSCGFNANMTSNGYLLNQERIQEMAMYNFTGAQITLDGDRETHNSIRFHKQGADTFTKIMENIHLLVKSNIHVTLRINCTHKNLDSVLKIPESFKTFTTEEKKFIWTDLQIVWQEGNHTDLYQRMDKIVETFNKNDIPTSKMDFRSFCYGDKRNSCIVNFNGDLYKCTAVDFHNTRRDGYLSEEGNLVWENNSVEIRMESKFRNGNCITCRIFPLCHAGCTKQSLLSDNYCLHHNSDDEKDSIVINRILYNSLTNQPHPL